MADKDIFEIRNYKVNTESVDDPKDVNTKTDESEIVGSAWMENKISENYLVKIYSSALNCEVVGVLQDNFVEEVASSWNPIAGFERAKNIGNSLVFQKIFGVVGVVPWMSRRKWEGTTPVSITLNLMFQANSNPMNEVVKPCLRLKQMVLPGHGTKYKEGKTDDKSYFLVPPGPSPIGWFEENNAKTDQIEISIGNLVTYESVIVKNVRTEIEPKFDKNGNPIMAKATIGFESYEIMTKDSIGSAYGNKSLPTGFLEEANTTINGSK